MGPVDSQVQQALAVPGQLERFVESESDIALLREASNHASNHASKQPCKQEAYVAPPPPATVFEA